MAESFPLVKLDLYKDNHLFDPPFSTFTDETRIFRVNSLANSILATVYVKTLSGGGDVTVKWFDFGPGDGDSGAGERIDLASHDVITASDTSDRKLITRMHGSKVRCEVIVTGTATLGIFATGISDFPNEPAILDAQDADLTEDKGAPVALYDSDTDKWYLWRGNSSGVACVKVEGAVTIDGTVDIGDITGTFSGELPGTPKLFSGSSTVSTTPQTLIDEIVPALKIWKVRQTKISSYAYGCYDVFVDSIKIGNGRTSPIEANTADTWISYHKAIAGEHVKIVYTANANLPVTDVDAFLQITEEDAS